MNSLSEQKLISKMRVLSEKQVAEVEDFVEFLAARSLRQAALDRLLAMGPAIENAGLPPLSDEEINAEVKAVRAERRLKEAA